ncbi:unnamed protein product [Rhizophagus irregularis]|nr:unnamed protein product [Rhizophagus irregularis]
MKPDLFKTPACLRNQTLRFRSLEKGKPRFVSSGGLPSSEERKTKDSIGWTSDEWFRGNEREAKMKGKRKRKGKGKKEKKNENERVKRKGKSKTKGDGFPKEYFKIRSGGLPTNGTKIRSGGLLKNGKTQRFDRVDFRRSEKGELKSWLSRVSSEEQKKPRFVSGLGWFLKNGKYTNLNGFDPGSVSKVQDAIGLLFRRFILEIDFYLFNILYRFKIAIDIILIS